MLQQAIVCLHIGYRCVNPPIRRFPLAPDHRDSTGVHFHPTTIRQTYTHEIIPSQSPIPPFPRQSKKTQYVHVSPEIKEPSWSSIKKTPRLAIQIPYTAHDAEEGYVVRYMPCSIMGIEDGLARIRGP